MNKLEEIDNKIEAIESCVKHLHELVHMLNKRIHLMNFSEQYGPGLVISALYRERLGELQIAEKMITDMRKEIRELERARIEEAETDKEVATYIVMCKHDGNERYRVWATRNSRCEAFDLLRELVNKDSVSAVRLIKVVGVEPSRCRVKEYTEEIYLSVYGEDDGSIGVVERRKPEEDKS
jgi:hypothetical protein